MSRVFSNTTSLMTSVCMLYVGAMAASSYLSKYADKLLKGENQSNFLVHVPIKSIRRFDEIIQVIKIHVPVTGIFAEFGKSLKPFLHGF